MLTWPVAEIFSSINGEGLKAGALALFIRFAGCNLRCSWCDTAWATPADAPAQPMTLEDILATVRAEGIRNITLTGGEPLLQPELSALIATLIADGRSVEIETNGSLPVGALLPLRREYPERLALTVDYKLGGSGQTKHMHLDNLLLLESQDCVKFVAASTADLAEAAEVIRRHNLTGRTNVFLSPCFGSLEPMEMVEFMKKECLNGVRLQLQLHKIIWSPDQRGV